MKKTSSYKKLKEKSEAERLALIKDIYDLIDADKNFMAAQLVKSKWELIRNLENQIWA